MRGRPELEGIADRVLEMSGADQTEVMIAGVDSQLTRFAANAIHQNVNETDVTVRVRAIFGKKVGVASTNDLSIEALRRVVASAETVARFQQDNPDFHSLPGPATVSKTEAYSPDTASCAPEKRAQGVAAICTLSRENGLEAAGAFSTRTEELLIANSLGLSVYDQRTTANVMTVVMGDDSSGYGEETAIDVTNLDPEAVARTAVDKALRSRNPTDIEPGAYTVILEEGAVATMVSMLAYLGLGALSVQEGRSFMCGRFGEQITGENITLWDDGLDPRGLVNAFDFEGVPKQRVMLIEKGVARGVVYDTFTAGREEGKTSTGHGLPAPNTGGPFPMNLFMAPGQASKKEMIASIDKGIWVTRFHYTNPVHPIKTVITGMTRDGTFLIENGEITRPLKNMRFTQSVLEAFSHADMLHSELKLIPTRGSFGMCVPMAKIDGFTFSGKTEF